ncbi:MULTISPECIES: LppX_LprAFG lipoprotein [Nocardioides]|uniref:LppX_LprAFG lipoprotein n=1 Tax=Nocardioides vastitatis TaxID=2568655 RepID=A0ABW0ZLT6_9ACTN|nr:LppX_LprAFG lipoprotein [Nocardioides sp.]
MTIRLGHRRATRVAAAVLVGLLSVTGLASCTGGSDDSVTSNKELDDDDDGEVSPQEVMEGAKRHLDETSGITVELSTGDDPGVDFLSAATGTIVAEPPAFEGTVSGRVSGFEASSINVVSTGGTLYVEAPVVGWTDDYQPAELCAPDPALLLDPDTGVGNVLTSSEDLEEGDTERGGQDNKVVLTTFTGTAPGDAIRELLPCAEDDSYDVRYRVDSDGKLQSVDMTGAFFPDSEPVTYAIEVTGYDVTKDISAPQ